VSIDEFSAARLLFGKYDILHMHWPEHHFIRLSAFQTLLRAVYLLGILSMARICGTRLVWTVHNLQPHKQYHPLIEKWFWKTFTRLIDAYFSLSSSAIEQILRQYPALCRKKGFVALHGHYRGFYRDDLSKSEARKKLDVAVSATVIVFFGYILSYKNVPSLINIFSQLRSEDLTLLIAGKPDGKSIEEEIKGLSKNDSRIRLHLGHVQGDDIQLYLKAADLVVLPFLEILNSGSALLSLSFGCPILVPEKGSMGELRASVGDEWVCTYRGELTSEKVQDALDWAIGARRTDYPDLGSFEWDKAAEQTKRAFERCLG
jgi:glycosyltransferase involved in cell wall biosynthesis